ncbi:MAG TPA: methyltransferase [Nitrososphaeraceae archaeon]
MPDFTSNSDSTSNKNSDSSKSTYYMSHLQNFSFTILDMLAHSQLSQAIYIIAKFRIADYLKNGPKSVKELAEQSKTHPDSLYRLLRMLASVGIFTEIEEKEDWKKEVNNNNKRKFDITPKAALLQSETKGSIRNFALMFGLESFNRAIYDLSYSIETGENSFKHANGLDMFEYFQQDQNRKDAQIFNSAMASLSSSHASSMFSMYDFSQFTTVADIGGGQGILLSHLLKTNPNLRGILFDLPHAIESAKSLHTNVSGNPRLEDSGDFLSRCKLVEGDFFKSIPLGADGYIIKSVILNWDDDSATKILKNCLQAMKKTKAKAKANATTMTTKMTTSTSQNEDRQNGYTPKLLIIDLIMQEGNKPFIGKFIDIVMLALTHKGRIRTEKEYRNLLHNSGFDITKIVYPSDYVNFLSIIEAIPSFINIK